LSRNYGRKRKEKGGEGKKKGFGRIILLFVRISSKGDDCSILIVYPSALIFLVWEIGQAFRNGIVYFQFAEMWWSPEEEAMQQLAQAVWANFPHAQFPPPDQADELADLAADPEEVAEDPAFPEDEEDMDDEIPPPNFMWHLPEGAPDPEPDAGPPYLNGFHQAVDMDGLAEVMAAPWAVFNLPNVEDNPPG
jgi:hypothetical protein